MEPLNSETVPEYESQDVPDRWAKIKGILMSAAKIILFIGVWAIVKYLGNRPDTANTKDFSHIGMPELKYDFKTELPEQKDMDTFLKNQKNFDGRIVPPGSHFATPTLRLPDLNDAPDKDAEAAPEPDGNRIEYFADLVEKAEDAFKKEQYATAEQLYERACKLATGSLKKDCLYNLGASRHNRVIQEYNRGVDSYNNGRYSDAIKAFQGACPLLTGDDKKECAANLAMGYYKRGRRALDKEDYKSGAADLRQALSLKTLPSDMVSLVEITLEFAEDMLAGDASGAPRLNDTPELQKEVEQGSADSIGIQDSADAPSDGTDPQQNRDPAMSSEHARMKAWD